MLGYIQIKFSFSEGCKGIRQQLFVNLNNNLFTFILKELLFIHA